MDYNALAQQFGGSTTPPQTQQTGASAILNNIKTLN